MEPRGELLLTLVRGVGFAAYDEDEVRTFVRIVLAGVPTADRVLETFDFVESGSDPEWNETRTIQYPGADLVGNPYLIAQVMREGQYGEPATCIGLASCALKEHIEFPDKHGGEQLLSLVCVEDNEKLTAAGRLRIEVAYKSSNPPTCGIESLQLVSDEEAAKQGFSLTNEQAEGNRVPTI